MPFYRKIKTFTPLSSIAANKSIKSGVHHAIFTSRRDVYVGDWKNDLKEGAFLKIKYHYANIFKVYVNHQCPSTSQYYLYKESNYYYFKASLPNFFWS